MYNGESWAAALNRLWSVIDWSKFSFKSMLYTTNRVYHVNTFVASASGNYTAFSQDVVGILASDRYASINYLLVHFNSSRRFYCDVRINNISIADVSTSTGTAGTTITIYY